MKYFLKRILLLLILCLFSLFSCCDFFMDLIGMGRISITNPPDNSIVGTSTIEVSVEATWDYIDYVTLKVGSTTVYTTDEGYFSHAVTLSPRSNTITATCYAYDDEEDIFSSYAGSDSISVYYDNADPDITISYPTNWDVIATGDVTITGTVSDTSYLDGYGVKHVYLFRSGSFTIFDDHVVFSTGTGTLTYDRPGLSNGTYSYLFMVEDYAGRSVVKSVTFIVDIP